MDGPVDQVVDHYISTVQAATGSSLEHRADRTGDGRLRILHGEVTAADGSPARTGLDAEISLRFKLDAPPDCELGIGVSVEGPLGEPVFVCSTRVTGQVLRTVDSAGELVCSISRLPLLPGRYAMSIYAEVNGVLADWVRNALFFDVFESDVFGSGQLPPTSHGRVFVDHSWTVSEPSATGSRPAS